MLLHSKMTATEVRCCLQVLTQERAAIKIQAGVRGLLTRRRVHNTAQEELQFIGMKPKVGPCLLYNACLLNP